MGHKCDGTNVTYTFKIFEAVNLTLHMHDAHVCTVFKVIGINTENKIFLPNKEYISIY